MEKEYSMWNQNNQQLLDVAVESWTNCVMESAACPSIEKKVYKKTKLKKLKQEKRECLIKSIESLNEDYRDHIDISQNRRKVKSFQHNKNHQIKLDFCDICVLFNLFHHFATFLLQNRGKYPSFVIGRTPSVERQSIQLCKLLCQVQIRNTSTKKKLMRLHSMICGKEYCSKIQRASISNISVYQSDKETLEDYGYQIQEVKRFHKMPIVKVMLSKTEDALRY
ncbi:hypothetical protein RFI_00391 [Reticulomyxa filosa]|uniref:Uncharacterized protein n=1 Tax=Reticulomyxa filosa TaxID=46433 RepID=X6PDT7_RETFI|nr:hypothetical protein RFI_00391 [Reticulomyxa filosa]|eukprot:ETO36670.1 hypothetical protein RFI_00391 [Reticulomyxa filosa]